MVDLFRYRHWDLVSKRGLYYIISCLLMIIGFAAMIMNYNKHGEIVRRGIDFTGGGGVTYSVQGRLSTDDHAKLIKGVRDGLSEAGVQSEVQISPASVGSGEGDQIIVRTALSGDAAVNQDAQLTQDINDSITPVVTEVVAQYLPNAPAPKLVSTEAVSATVSQELLNKGALALILGSLLIMCWIGLRYNIGGFGMRYSVAGIVALLHDLLVLVGVFALLYNVLEVNSPFIAALLTVLGYSIHDTIVIFDRIRENIRHRKGRTFAETVNISLLETMARSVNTVLTVLFTLLALLFFGGPTLRDFVAAMLIGLVAGAYSSIFMASQLLVSWSKGNDRLMLPADVPIPAVAGEAAAVSAPELVASVTSSTNTSGATSREAIRRARQAGKSAKANQHR